MAAAVVESAVKDSGGGADHKSAQKNAVNSEHVARKVQSLDKVIGGINQQYRDAQDKLVRMKLELEKKQKFIELKQAEREKLAKQVQQDKAKAMGLRASLRRADQSFGKVLDDIQGGARRALNGDGQGKLGLRQVSSKLISQELACSRGYSCANGTTMTVSGGSGSTTRLPRGIPSLSD